MMRNCEPTVEIREDRSVGGKYRMLVVDKPFVSAMQFPATYHGPEEWWIVAELGLPPAVVHSENDARAWMRFLAGLSR